MLVGATQRSDSDPYDHNQRRDDRPCECTVSKDKLGSEDRKEEMYESRSRTRREQFLADQRCSSASTGTRSSAGEDARKRHLLHRCAPNAWTPSRTISSNPWPRTGGRDHHHGS